MKYKILNIHEWVLSGTFENAYIVELAQISNPIESMPRIEHFGSKGEYFAIKRDSVLATRILNLARQEESLGLNVAEFSPRMCNIDNAPQTVFFHESLLGRDL